MPRLHPRNFKIKIMYIFINMQWNLYIIAPQRETKLRYYIEVQYKKSFIIAIRRLQRCCREKCSVSYIRFMQI